jgi:hypothetical protein
MAALDLRGVDVSELKMFATKRAASEFAPTNQNEWCGEHPDFAAYLESRKANVDATATSNGDA